MARPTNSNCSKAANRCLSVGLLNVQKLKKSAGKRKQTSGAKPARNKLPFNSPGRTVETPMAA